MITAQTNGRTGRPAPDWPGPGRLTVTSSAAQAGERVAAALVADCDEARALGRRPTLGWPVGRTPRPVIAALARRARATDLDLGDVVIALMDDYVTRENHAWCRVPEDAVVSCRGMAVRELVDPLNALLPPRRRLDPEALWSPDPRAPHDYDGRIAQRGGIDAFLVALGGSDGHIGLNPPGTPRTARTRIVDVADSTRADNVATFAATGIEQVPTAGVTVGLATTTDARHVIVLALGPGKRATLARLLTTPSFDPAWPMTALVAHRDTSVYCDEEAAGPDLAAR